MIPLIYLLIAVTTLASVAQNIIQRKYGDRCKGGTFLFTGMVAFCAMIFFAAVNRDWYYDTELLIPSALFALSYIVGYVMMVLALRYGPLAKTSLIIAFSLLIPTFYGLIVNKDPVSTLLVIGLILFAISVFAVNYQKKQDDQKVTVKWIVFVLFAFVGNGMSSVVQKGKQDIFGEAGNNVFMIVALAIVSVTMIVLAVVLPEERKMFREAAKKGWYLAALCGFANGLVNLLVITLNPKVPASVLFPVLSGSGMVLIFLYSVFIRREKFTVWQTIGFFIGIASIVLLNL